ncbi:hypothetical protein FCM35_KLT05539 [Carex littledalei]|uniref:Uncharacterized protein n=1 Tax=Carex littledalei TaxID=544730 RepID=A0A833VPC6_9POAL|nr:hypothetical protein FCM35_KLT05539 [Carex littledalei]
MRLPRFARDLESSRKGSMWPKASHGKTKMWRESSDMVKLTVEIYREVAVTVTVKVSRKRENENMCTK